MVIGSATQICTKCVPHNRDFIKCSRVLAREHLKGGGGGGGGGVDCHTFTSKTPFYTHKTHIWLSMGLCATCRKGGGVK